MSTQWTWSRDHRQYYRYTTDATGQQTCEWSEGGQSLPVPQQTNIELTAGSLTSTDASTEHRRSDSGTAQDVAHDPNMIPAASDGIRDQLQFTGTPGWYDPLDSSYRVRTRAEAHSFFRTGRVFSMLWSETAGETRKRGRGGTENSAITTGKFCQGIFSQIRRFVVVRVNRSSHFVYACAIFTYGNQGALKPGCKTSEHAIVYFNGTQPMLLDGEFERGLTKDPIMIDPSQEAIERGEQMHYTSRLRCGKVFSIEWNVKVRDIGMVSSRDRSKLIQYFKEEDKSGFDLDEENDYTPQTQAQFSISSLQIPHTAHQSQQSSATSQYQQPRRQDQWSRGGYQYPQQHQQQYQQPAFGYTQSPQFNSGTSHDPYAYQR